MILYRGICPACGAVVTASDEPISFWGAYCSLLPILEPLDERDELGEAGA